jgi:flagellar biosynthesis protein FlhA
MSGNFLIRIIVFTILVIVNFVVITKGSGRMAEVAARFHTPCRESKWRSTPTFPSACP